MAQTISALLEPQNQDALLPGPTDDDRERKRTALDDPTYETLTTIHLICIEFLT